MITAAILLAAASVLPHCSWDKPGVNPFTGNVPAAVEAYTDIPAPVRQRLRERMEKRQYDEVAEIRRESVVGVAHTYSDLRDMHFGAGQRCGKVSRASWPLDVRERGLVYCEAEHCIIVPTVCRNVSRVTRQANLQISERVEMPVALMLPPVQFMDQPEESLNQIVPGGSDEDLRKRPFAGLTRTLVPAGSGGSVIFEGGSFYGSALPPLPFRSTPIFSQPTALDLWTSSPSDNTFVTPIPEPATYMMVLIGVLCIVVSRALRFRRNRLAAVSFVAVLLLIPLTVAAQVSKWAQISESVATGDTYDVDTTSLNVVRDTPIAFASLVIRHVSKSQASVTFLRMSISEQSCSQGTGIIVAKQIGTDIEPSSFPYVRDGGTVATIIGDVICRTAFKPVDLLKGRRL